MSGLVCGSALLACHASYDCGKTHPGLRPSLGFCLRSRLIRLLPGAQRFFLSRLARLAAGRLPFGSGWSPGRPAALRSPSLRSRLPCTTAAKPIRGCAPPWAFASAPVLSACSRALSASYLISLLVLPARNWDTSPVLFSSLYRPGTAAYRAAQVTRSSFQVISLGAWAWLSAPGPKPTQGMP